MSMVITQPPGVREEYEALREQITALEEQVAIQDTTIEDLLAQRERLNNLAQRVEELVAALGATRTERDAAIGQTARLRNDIVLLGIRLTTQDRDLQIARLHTERAQLLRQLAEIDQVTTQTQTVFGGVGVTVGAFWGTFAGPLGTLIGAGIGGIAMVLAGTDDVTQRQQPRRTHIETRIRQINQALLTLGDR